MHLLLADFSFSFVFHLPWRMLRRNVRHLVSYLPLRPSCLTKLCYFNGCLLRYLDQSYWLCFWTYLLTTHPLLTASPNLSAWSAFMPPLSTRMLRGLHYWSSWGAGTRWTPYILDEFRQQERQWCLRLWYLVPLIATNPPRLFYTLAETTGSQAWTDILDGRDGRSTEHGRSKTLALPNLGTALRTLNISRYAPAVDFLWLNSDQQPVLLTHL